MSVITTRQLTRRYGRRIGVEGLNLSVDEGTLFGFLGPNGSGKTTTIRVLLGLLKPSGGGAQVFGLDCWKDSHRIKADVGYVPGDLRLYSWLTCRIALDIFGKVRGRNLYDTGTELAADLDLELDVRVRAMSRGMRQKLGLVLALAHQPRLLVLDEPTAGLDPIVQEKLYRRLGKLAADGHTIFFSSHTLDEVERLCDRVAILRRGRLVADERLDDLRGRAHRLVSIQWKPDANAEKLAPPDFLDVFARGDCRWRARLTGPAIELARWSAAQPIADLSIGEPDLNSIFQRFYLDEETDA